MEPITAIDACQILGISHSYLIKLQSKMKTARIKTGYRIYYTEANLAELKSIVDQRKDIESRLRKRALTYLENVPAGYVATTNGLWQFLGKKVNIANVLGMLDTVYEEDLGKHLVILGLTDNHVFETEETDEETDAVIKAMCLKKETVEWMRSQNGKKQTSECK